MYLHSAQEVVKVRAGLLALDLTGHRAQFTRGLRGRVKGTLHPHLVLTDSKQNTKRDGTNIQKYDMIGIFFSHQTSLPGDRKFLATIC